MSRTTVFLLVAFLSVLKPTSTPAQVIDFESLPGGGATVDQQQIFDEYLSLGVTFTLLDRTTGEPVGYPRIAKAGPPVTAFEGCLAVDTPWSYLGLGESFLTDGTSIGVEGDLRVEYVTPVAQASGLIIDVDCRIDGGPPCEQWTITAYDSLGQVVQSVVLDAPQGAPNPRCKYPQSGPGDSNAIGWGFDAGAAVIKTIVLRYTGTPTDVGLAFDHFSVSSLPAQLDVVATSQADTVCVDDPIVLSAFPSGGFPPYTFQWQQEVAPSSWIDLGSDDTQEVRVLGTAHYRVTVTDVNEQEATSAPVTVAAESGGPLCSASLLVSCNSGSNVVRYSFRSPQPEVFVPSGSGGLSGPSKLVCGPDGNLYVSSQDNDRVLRYDGTTGEFIDIFVAGGSGGLDNPVGLDFGPDGNLYVVSNATSSVLRYNGSTGAFIDAFVPTGSGLNSPTGLVFGPDDNLYVCSRNSDKVLRFDGTTGAPLGDFVTSGSGGLDAPRGLVFGPDGNLYIGEEVNDSVRRYNGSTGAFIDVFIPSGSGGLDRANDVGFGADGVCYVPSFNNSKVLAYDAATGAFLGALLDGILKGPAWIAVGCRPAATGIPEGGTRPLKLTVEPGVPNPFNPRTTVGFTIPESGSTRVTVVDVAGRVVATLIDRSLPAGRHVVEWSGETSGGRSAPSGVYFIRVENGGITAVRKTVLLR